MRDLSDISNEALANILRGMILTGITVSDCEREYLEEAAKRLENEERIILNDR